MNLLVTGDGSTPLSPEELNDLIPDLTTREELNEFEFQNILQASAWIDDTRRRKDSVPTREPYLREVHRRMFDQTWRWAGSYRSTNKNIGVPHYQVRDALMGLLGDTHYWIQHRTYPPDELAIRYHHRLVAIHPFPNGNGRHARLLADALLRHCAPAGTPPFPWGGGDLTVAAETRKAYIAALKRADQHDIYPLLAFARSHT